MLPSEHYTAHYVSTKVALYSADKTKVLIMRYGHAADGLPGGHLEKDETPDMAIAREFMEELGAVLPPVVRTDFFLRNGEEGDVILGFIGIAPEHLVLEPPKPQFERGEWIAREQLADYGLSASYRKFILDNWPA